MRTITRWSLMAGLLLVGPVLAGCPGGLGREAPPAGDGAREGLTWPDGSGPWPDADGAGTPVDGGPDAVRDTTPAADTLPADTVPADLTPCSAYPEKLDNKDNNCNGKVDEGYWAKPLQASYSALSARQPLCSASKAFSDVCTSGAHRLCTSKGYVGGFGPVEYGATQGTIVCLADALATSAGIASLTARHSGCTAKTVFSLWCNSAIHRHCSKLKGYVSGVGPVEHTKSTSHFICVKHATIYSVGFATLAGHHSGCKASDSFAPACQAAINRYCSVRGHATGFGPVEQTTTAQVVCLDAK